MYNLSEPQKAVYYMAVATENSTTNVVGDVFFDFDVSVDEARETATAFLNTCSIMHTRIFLFEGKPMQKIEEKHINDGDIEVKKFNDWTEYYKWTRSDALKPIDVFGCLYRLYVVKIENKVGFYCATHHIINDATSFNIMASFACEFLKEKKIKKILSYTDYIKHEEVYKQSNRYVKDKDFWIKIYNSCADELSAEAYVTPSKSARKSIEIDRSLSAKIKQYCCNTENSEYSAFMAITAIWYYRIFQNNSFFIGSPMLNRCNAKEENTFGLFVNTVPIPFTFYDNYHFSDLCAKTNDTIMSAFRHQKYHYTQLLKDVDNKNKNFGNLFDVIVSFINAKTAADSHIGWFGTENQIESLHVHIEDRENNGVFKMHYDYQTEKYNEEDIERIHAHLCKLFLEAIENPDKRISELEMLSAEEKNKILKTFNDTAADYPKDKCVHKLFEELTEKNPDRIAVVACDRTLTYRELNEEANRIAHSLIERGVGIGDIVAFNLPRRSYLISTILGIIKAGASFLPLDPDYPLERIEYILSDSNAKFNITEKNIYELIGCSNKENPDVLVKSTDNCYCIYTSGSTGKPKGTLICHNNVINFCNDTYSNNLQHYIACECNVVLACGSIVFDISNFEILLSLLLAKCVVLANEQEVSNADFLAELIETNSVDCLHCTPTKLRTYFCSKKFSVSFRNIKCVMVGGEQFVKDLYYTIRNCSNAKIFNGYGPTETTMGVSFGEIDDGIVTIGKPIANTQIYITDKYMNPVPIGVTGEICIAGDGVGAGYLNRPDLMDEKFIDNHFGEGKLYKTGDLAYWREDGNIVFVGRNDFQVKIRGLRIELGEIENALLNINGINMSVVVVRNDCQNRQVICAFYEGEEKSAKELRTELSAKLPRYMVPHIFIRLEKMPLTASGKINRNALPEISLENISTDTEYMAPLTEKEKVLARSIKSVLNVEKANMLDNFFNIGGDSIRAIYLVSELEEAGYTLHVADVMQRDTLSDIAEAMKETFNKTTYCQEEVNGFVPFSPIMCAFLKESNTIPKDFVHTCIISADCDEATARKALDMIVRHHDILRGTICDNGIEIHPSGTREVYSFKTVAVDDEHKAKEYISNAKIDDGKLVNVIFCSTEKESLISITVHHFLIDLVSWEILIKDFCMLVRQIKNNEEPSLPSKTTSFKLWNEELQKYSGAMPEENKEYWKKINARLDNAVSLCSYEEGENDAETYGFILNADVSDKLINKATNTYGTRTNEILLTALGLAAGRMAGGSVGIIVENHGRAELGRAIAVDRTVGWFTTCYPVVFDDNDDVIEELIKTKETLRRIPKNGIDYLLLSYGLHKNVDIVFNFYRSSIADEGGNNRLIAFNSGASAFRGKINVNCIIADNILTVDISVPRYNHKQKISKKLGDEFEKQIKKIVDLCTATDKTVKTSSDFSDDELTQVELDELKELFDWTDANEQ